MKLTTTKPLREKEAKDLQRLNKWISGTNWFARGGNKRVYRKEKSYPSYFFNPRGEVVAIFRPKSIETPKYFIFTSKDNSHPFSKKYS